jgi:RNA polymerase sigma-70 factor (ECF subfamily)
LRDPREARKTKPVAETLLDIAMMHSDALIARAREGDKNAQGKLVQLWYKRIYNFCYKFFYDHDQAMEASQKAFISMHRHMASLQDAGRFKSWLYTIAINSCREEARKQKSQRLLSLNEMQAARGRDTGWEQSTHRHDNPERQLRQAELSDLLHQCLHELSAEQREVVIMKEYEGLKFREIAEVLNISENTAKSRLYYGLETMKGILERRNITKESIGYEL